MTKKQRIWETDTYYDKARKGSLIVDHPGMRLLKQLSKDAKTILDLGCGEGTRLNWLTKNTNKRGVGVDISKKATKMATKSFPKLTFVEGNLEKLVFNNNKFDLVCSAYVLEHLENAEKVINEAIRVTKRGGKVIFIAPNFGAPNRASPLNKESRMFKLIVGLMSDMTNIISNTDSLAWKKINMEVDIKDYKPDYDTTLEPYIGTLIKFLKKENIEIEKALSCWNQELPGANILQQLIGIVGKLGLYPFWMWGPHLIVAGRKN